MCMSSLSIGEPFRMVFENLQDVFYLKGFTNDFTQLHQLNSHVAMGHFLGSITRTFGAIMFLAFDPLPNSLLDSKMSLRQKTTERLGARGTLPSFQHFKGQKGVLELQDGTKKSDKLFIHLHESTSNQPQVVSTMLEHLWCQDKPWATSDSQDSPRPELRGDPPPSPIEYTLHLFVRPTSKWFFILGLPFGSPPETSKVGTLATLWGYNFVLRPSIKMRSKSRLQLSLRAFQQHVTHHLHARKSGRFLTFCGRESICQF